MKTKIEVLYKDYGKFDGDLHLINEEYDIWKEDGNYTYFYKDEKIQIIVPTHAVCWIKPKKVGE